MPPISHTQLFNISLLSSGSIHITHSNIKNYPKKTQIFQEKHKNLLKKL
jgi:hypothetical protein